MAKIIDFPDVDKLKEEVKSLRKELVSLIFSHDDRISHEAIRVEAEYQEEFGLREYKVMNLNLTVKKLKEEKRLVESFIRRDEPVDFYYISKIISSEFTKDEKILRDKLTVIGSLDKYAQRHSLSDKSLEELNNSYIKIIDKINPLVNPDLSLEEWDLYKDALDAFTNYEPYFLGAIADIVDDNYHKEYYLRPNDSLYAEKIRLTAAIEAIKDSIEEISKAYPLKLKKFLVDKKARRSKNEILNKRIASLKEARRSLEEDLKILLEAYND